MQKLSCLYASKFIEIYNEQFVSLIFSLNFYAMRYYITISLYTYIYIYMINCNLYDKFYYSVCQIRCSKFNNRVIWLSTA